MTHTAVAADEPEPRRVVDESRTMTAATLEWALAAISQPLPIPSSWTMTTATEPARREPFRTTAWVDRPKAIEA